MASDQQNQEVTHISGTGISVRGNDIDTDQIIPARFMKVVSFEGLGEYAFHDMRFNEKGQPKIHPFNDQRYNRGSILIVNGNFGCGSSREHAPQAIMRWGIQAIVGESFAEIFAGNCTAMGVPAICLSPAQVRELQATVEEAPETVIDIDLPSRTLKAETVEWTFELPDAYRNALTAGSWDSTSVLMANLENIRQTAERLPYMNDFQ